MLPDVSRRGVHDLVEPLEAAANAPSAKVRAPRQQHVEGPVDVVLQEPVGLEVEAVAAVHLEEVVLRKEVGMQGKVFL